MSTKFTLTRLANAPQVRLRVYAGGHQVHVDLESFDLEELVRESTALAVQLGYNSALGTIDKPAKAKKRKARKPRSTDDWQD